MEAADSQNNILEKVRTLGVKNPATPSIEDIALFLAAFIRDNTLSIEEYREYLRHADCPPITFVLGHKLFSETAEVDEEDESDQWEDAFAEMVGSLG